MQPLYNREGRAVAYIADNESSIYLYDGGPVGWLHQGAVHAYDGRFLGWMMYGWLCDPEGHPAFFTDRAQGGPKRPPKQPRPVRGSREFRPQRAQRLTRPTRPGMKTTWSARSDESFFMVAGWPESAPLASAGVEPDRGEGAVPEEPHAAADAAIDEVPAPGIGDGEVSDPEAAPDQPVDAREAARPPAELTAEPTADRRED